MAQHMATHMGTPPGPTVHNRPSTSSTAPATKKSHTTRNTAHLAARLGADVLAALTASALVAPIVTILDKSIIIRTHTAQPLRTIVSTAASQALHRPLIFLISTPYLLIHGLYAGTYLAANLTDTVGSTLRDLPAAHIGSGTEKFVATAAFNMSACLYKDARFARFFGAAAATTGSAAATAARASVPRTSLALFAARDAMTVFASFNAPTMLAPFLGGSVSAAQFLAPAGVQLLSTPLHLLGLDLYNRPRQTSTLYSPNKPISMHDRWQIVRRDWLGASFARMGRIVPAYGLGGVVNRNVRTWLMGRAAP